MRLTDFVGLLTGVISLTQQIRTWISGWFSSSKMTAWGFSSKGEGAVRKLLQQTVKDYGSNRVSIWHIHDEGGEHSRSVCSELDLGTDQTSSLSHSHRCFICHTITN